MGQDRPPLPRRVTPSRPARALRVATVGLIGVVIVRMPAMRDRYEAALVAGRAMPTAAPSVALRDGPPAGRLQGTAPAASARKSPVPSPVVPKAIAAVVAERTWQPRTWPGALAAVTPPRQVAVAAVSAPPVTLPRTAAVAAPVARAPSPGDLAAAAYARLAAGDRRGAVHLFDAALAGNDARAGVWRRQRDALVRRWSGSAYSIVRAAGSAGLTAEPILGGSQSGAAIAFAPDPLAPRPLALTLRAAAGHDDAGRSAYGAAGVEWRPFAGVTLAAERRIALGPAAHGAWSLRLAAGGERRVGGLRLTGYGEGGIVGTAPYAAVQGRAAAIVRTRGIAVEPGAGVWASVEHDRATVDRVDLGPGVAARAGGLAFEVDYRFRLAGNAAPASGPVLTLTAAF